MIDLNDHQLDQYGNNFPLLTNTTFKDHIEKDCRGYGSSLRDAKYIY